MRLIKFYQYLHNAILFCKLVNFRLKAVFLKTLYNIEISLNAQKPSKSLKTNLKPREMLKMLKYYMLTKLLWLNNKT